MHKYGLAAIKAVELVTSGLAKGPAYAWEKATTEIFESGTSSQKKGCPRDAFLGLCEDGLVKGIPGGCYTRSKKNKAYAVRAVRVLKETPKSTYDPSELWSEVIGSRKTHNGQMNVVLSLWGAGLLR
jgi:hypothetical protein